MYVLRFKRTHTTHLYAARRRSRSRRRGSGTPVERDRRERLIFTFVRNTLGLSYIIYFMLQISNHPPHHPPPPFETARVGPDAKTFLHPARGGLARTTVADVWTPFVIKKTTKTCL